jgi:phospholipid/cholesterol/gamma-HCH transport system permease protein
MKIYEPELPPSSKYPLILLGHRVLLSMRGAGRALLLWAEALFYSIVHFKKRRREIGRQMMISGVKSIGVVSIVAFFTGMILCLQTGIILLDYGQEVNVGTVVTLTLCREMGPFVTALIVAASVGSSMAAEIGTMAVSEEISALHVMSVNPASYLISPRLAALLFMVPALTIYANALGVLGGMIVAKTQLGVEFDAYYRNALSQVGHKDMYVGILKAVVFGQIITMVSCYQGVVTTNGAIGVGRAARRSVVVCFLFVLVTGYFITRMFY